MNEDRPLYYVELSTEEPGVWRVLGPNGLVDAYRSQAEAEARADRLNEDVAEEQEDDA